MPNPNANKPLTFEQIKADAMSMGIPVRALMDMIASGARSSVATTLGLPSDLANTAIGVHNMARDIRRGKFQGYEPGTIPMGSEQIKEFIPDVSKDPNSNLNKMADFGGNFAVIPGSGKLAMKGLKSVGQEIADRVATGQGLIPKVGEPQMAMHVIKPEKGGNWVNDTIKEALNPLTKSVLNDEGIKNLAERQGQDVVNNYLKRHVKDVAINNWVNNNLKNYIKNDMATPHDPVRLGIEQRVAKVEANNAKEQKKIAKLDEKIAQARQSGDEASAKTMEATRDNLATEAEDAYELGMKHTAHVPHENFNFNTKYWGQNSAPWNDQKWMATTEPSKAWEGVADNSLGKAKGSLINSDFDLYKSVREQQPELKNISRDANVYNIQDPKNFGNDLGFDHVVDTIKQHLALPETDKYHLKPEQLKNISVPQMMERVANHNLERELASRNVALQQQEGFPIVKEYPSGHKWIELTKPTVADDLPSTHIVEPYMSKGELGKLYRVINTETGMRGEGYATPERAIKEFNKNFVEDKLSDALKYEGDKMGHCVGGYCPDVLEGRTRIFSLRDKRGEPHVTIEAKNPKIYTEIHQIKGKGNAAPVDKYLPMVQDFQRTTGFPIKGDLQNSGFVDTHPELKKLGENIGLKVPDYLTKDEENVLRQQVAPHVESMVKNANDFLDTHPAFEPHRQASEVFNRAHNSDMFFKDEEQYSKLRNASNQPLHPDIPNTYNEFKAVLNNPEEYGEGDPLKTQLYTLGKIDELRNKVGDVPTVNPLKHTEEQIQEHSFQPASTDEAQKHLSNGHYVYGLHEQANEPHLIRSADEVNAYTPDQMAIVPKHIDPEPEGYADGGAVKHQGFINPSLKLANGSVTLNPMEFMPNYLSGGKVHVSDDLDMMRHEIEIKPMRSFKDGGQEGEDLTKPAFVYPTVVRHPTAPRGDVNTLPDPKTYAMVSGLLGTPPDEQGFSVLHPDLKGIKTAGDIGYATGIGANLLPLVGGALKLTGEGANLRMLSGKPILPSMFGEPQSSLFAREPKMPSGLRPSEEDAFRSAYESIKENGGVKRDTKLIKAETQGEEDIANSMLQNPVYKALGKIPQEDIDNALLMRKTYRAEPKTTPGSKAPESEWVDWGKKYGVDMSVSPDVHLGIKDPTTGRDVVIPGGLEGKFTIPDLFKIKANNIDPNALPKDVHDQLMQKFIRTHKIDNPDQVDMFNRLNFALLSPNAPLTPNEFLAQRARLVNMKELEALAGRADEIGLGKTADKQLGVGSAQRGGMGVKGTADLENQAKLAKIILEKPEMFQIQPGETMRDVTMRVMNQIPGLGPKTASLGTPWLDLEKANTSAVDLHMIRHSFKRLLDDPEVGDAFKERMASLLKTKPTTEAILAKDPKEVEKTAIGVIGGTSKQKMYRLKTGELNDIPSVATPDKLHHEPRVFQEFNPFYNKVVDYVDESRGQNPLLELFPEQWRKWDMYRQRIEPHEFAHPDFRKLPRQSWSEMAESLKNHKDAGYTGTKPVMNQTDWRDLYYGHATPGGMGALLGASGAGAAGIATYKYLDHKKKGGKVHMTNDLDMMRHELNTRG